VQSKEGEGTTFRLHLPLDPERLVDDDGGDDEP